LRGTWRNLAARGFAGCLGFVALLGCSDRGRDASGRVTLPIASEPDVVVDVATLQQRITGFGASSAWHSGGIFDEQADLFFSPSEGIGLSLLRLRIAPEGTTVENVVATKAHQRGARVWAAPWSPPGAWKSNGEVGNGGRLLPEYYDDWAARLATFAQTKASEGIPLIALSAQNEPDWVAEWETCEWTPAELTTFIRDHLGPELRARSPETRLLAPESANWDSLASYANAILDDEDAREQVGIIGVHDYGGTPYAYAAPADNGKEFWETEISYHDFTGIDVALQTANAIHEHLTLAQVNAFHYWWLLNDNPDGALFSAGQLNPQGYALGQYSKFIRPGFHRVASTPLAPSAGVVASAFFDTAGGKLVIVAVNSNATAVEQTFGIAGSGVTSMVAWTTSESESLEPGTAFAVGESFAYSLGAKSITTFVGDGSSVGPGSGGAGGQSGAEGGAANEGGAGGSDTGGPAGAPGEGGDSGSGGTAPGTGGSDVGTGGSDVGTGGSDVGTGGSDIEPTAGAPNGAGGTGTGGSSAGRGGRGGSRNTGDDDETRARPGNACACRTAGVSEASHGSWILVLGLGLLWSTRRRRRFATTP
jgi:glucuronoarabinoxylan endo-1,4-beta-xylanase